MTTVMTPRQTKYCTAIERALALVGHATNAELLSVMRREFPELSPTTVHRATTRLAQRGKIAIAPPDKDGSMRYDGNIKPHDHFVCSSCGLLHDTDVKDAVVPALEAAIAGCSISGRLTISGICKNCNDRGVI